MAEEQVGKKVVMTRAGLKQYEDELYDLKAVRRKEVAEKLKEAREQGDLSENAEYDAAKDEQRLIEERIAQLEEMFKHVEVVADEDISYDKVSIGTTVTLFDVEFEETIEYAIVGSSEANILNGMISNESPVGAALIGARKDETVTVETAAGVCTYKVLDIKKTAEKKKENKDAE